MSLRSLYENISEYSDFALIGRDFSAFDTDYSVLGFANSSDKTELVLLNFNCSKDDICCEDLTLRENIILEKKNNSDLSDDFSAIGQLLHIDRQTLLNRLGIPGDAVQRFMLAQETDDSSKPTA